MLHLNKHSKMEKYLFQILICIGIFSIFLMYILT